MMETVVALQGVSYAYASQRVVLADCSLQLRRGERLALTGSIGCGKTTLLELIIGLLRPTQGTVEVFGSARTAESDFHEVRQRVGFLFQDSDDQLFCPTVLEDVAFGPLNQGKRPHDVRQIVAQTLQSLGLNDFANRITHQLSGGEKRLVALASVLAMQPEILLLDEPTSGLDYESLERVTKILADLPQTMLFVSHDRSLTSRIATRTVRLTHGRLETTGEATTSSK